jgi:hypothetical protein
MKIHSWDFWDWKGIIQVCIFLIVLLLIFIFLIDGPKVYKEAQEKKMNMETTGTVIKFKKAKSAGTFENSSSVYLDGATIEYTYSVDTISYRGFEFVPNDVSNRNFLYRLFNSDNLSIKIKYSSKAPTKSIIDIDSL